MQDDLDQFEAGLRQIPPAATPPEMMARLRAATVDAVPSARPTLRRQSRWTEWFAAWRGLAAIAPAATMLLLWLALRPAAEPGQAKAAEATGIKVNAMQVNHALVASFDAVAQLPDGAPVRFHFRKWRDDVVMQDDANGVFITQSTPRVEVVPVRFETY